MERASAKEPITSTMGQGCLLGLCTGIAICLFPVACLFCGESSSSHFNAATGEGVPYTDLRTSWGTVAKASINPDKDALVAGFGRELLVLSLDDPSSPRLMGKLDFSNRINDLAVSGSIVAAALGVAGLGLADISDPARPRFLSKADTAGEGYEVALYPIGALLADGSAGLQVFNIDDPTSPRRVGNYSRPEYAAVPEDFGSFLNSEAGVTSVATSGNLAYIADRNLRVLDLADPSHPRLAGEYDNLRWARQVALCGDLAFALFIFSGPMAFDVSAPDRPAPRGVFMTNTMSPRMAAQGSLVYVADESALSVLDWTDPLYPKELGRAMIPGPALDLTVIGHHAYVAAEQAGLIILDVSDAKSIRVAAQINRLQ